MFQNTAEPGANSEMQQLVKRFRISSSVLKRMETNLQLAVFNDATQINSNLLVTHAVDLLSTYFELVVIVLSHAWDRRTPPFCHK